MVANIFRFTLGLQSINSEGIYSISHIDHKLYFYTSVLQALINYNSLKFLYDLMINFLIR